jgi:hypothetical protein
MKRKNKLLNKLHTYSILIYVRWIKIENNNILNNLLKNSLINFHSFVKNKFHHISRMMRFMKSIKIMNVHFSKTPKIISCSISQNTRRIAATTNEQKFINDINEALAIATYNLKKDRETEDIPFKIVYFLGFAIYFVAGFNVLEDTVSKKYTLLNRTICGLMTGYTWPFWLGLNVILFCLT